MEFDFIGPLSPAYAEFDNFFRFYFSQNWLESLLIRCGIKTSLPREIERQLNEVNAGTMDLGQMRDDLENFLVYMQDLEQELLPCIKQFSPLRPAASDDIKQNDHFILYKMAASVFPENTRYLLGLTETLLAVLPKKTPRITKTPGLKRKVLLNI